MRRTLLLMLLMSCAVLLPSGTAWAQDPLQAPACVEARAALDAAERQHSASASLQRLRQAVADRCLRAQADPAPQAASPRPTPSLRPPLVVAPTTVPLPRGPAEAAPAPSITAPAPPRPTQLLNCEASGCWDSNGVRLNRSGVYLQGPQGQMCTQQGSVLVCP